VGPLWTGLKNELDGFWLISLGGIAITEPLLVAAAWQRFTIIAVSN